MKKTLLILSIHLFLDSFPSSRKKCMCVCVCLFLFLQINSIMNCGTHLPQTAASKSKTVTLFFWCCIYELHFVLQKKIQI
jgi:hypothetical protein